MPINQITYNRLHGGVYIKANISVPIERSPSMASHLGLHCFFMSRLCSNRFKIFDITHFVRTMKCLQIKAIHREEITSVITTQMGSATGLNMGPIWVSPYAGCPDGSHMGPI